MFNGVLSPEQLDGLRLCVTPFQTTWFNVTNHRVTEQPSEGVTCFSYILKTASPTALQNVALAQLTANLIGNALKFTPAGGAVTIRLLRRGDETELSVSDSGPGLPPEVTERLFAPFVQGSNARGGLGIGLAVARWLVDLHGGTIEARARGEHGGAMLIVRLPVATSVGTHAARA